MPDVVTIVETPRDAFQGLPKLIPTAEKVRYIRALLNARFKHIDIGSFPSPAAVPQLADSNEVVKAFRSENYVERIGLLVNQQGLEQALAIGGLDSLGFPFSLSSQFQLRYTKTTTTQTWPLVERMISRIEQHDMSFMVYLSMAFGNPYGEPWDEEALFALIHSLCSMGVRHISLADTVAAARPEQVGRIFKRARAEQSKIQFSAHFHSRPENWFECVHAALEAGCRRFDATAGGLGGCALAQDTLVANIPSEELAARLAALGYSTGVDLEQAKACAALAQDFKKAYGP
ncbi:MAG: hydroxymethylglutaryl-CoA lyase [Planctomycetota bacterium]|nr:hydroxymethylglutaryl-CoA lyase [Planctomycetota bacterium]